MLIYLSIVNVIAFILCYIDKQLAIKHKQRISEKTLMIIRLYSFLMYKYSHL